MQFYEFQVKTVFIKLIGIYFKPFKARVTSSEWLWGKQVAAAQEEELRLCQQLPDHERSRNVITVHVLTIWAIAMTW